MSSDIAVQNSVSPDPTAVDSAALVHEIIALGLLAGVTIASAESLTGGALASAIVDQSGASAVFRGGVITYATDTKEQILGVDGDILATAGPVCSAVARQMACAVAKKFNADIGVATTGVAGPDPDEKTGQQPGIFYIAVVFAGEVIVKKFVVAAKSRQFVRQAAVAAALECVLFCMRSNRTAKLS